MTSERVAIAAFYHKNQHHSTSTSISCISAKKWEAKVKNYHVRFESIGQFSVKRVLSEEARASLKHDYVI